MKMWLIVVNYGKLTTINLKCNQHCWEPSWRSHYDPSAEEASSQSFFLQQRGLCPNEAESSKTSEADRRNTAAFVPLSRLQSSETIITLTSDACTQDGKEI